MSEYIQPGGGYYGGNRRLPAKSVYYPAPSAVAAEQQELGQYGAADQQLPPGAVPVINLPANAPPQPGSFKLLSFRQEVPAAAPPQLQQHPYQQYQPQALQQPLQQQLQQAYGGGAPALVNSDYAAAGWASQQYVTPIRVVNAPSQALSSQHQAQLAGLMAQSNADLQQAQSEYEQAMAMAQRAAERLGQLNGGLTPQVQHSGFGAPQSTVPGVHLPPAAAAQREQSQVRFGGVQRIPTPSNSSYRFEDAAYGKSAGTAPRKFNQQQADSVYIGMPNNLHYAANRSQNYHFAPQQQHQAAAYRQPSNANLQTARENASNANLRRMLSDENVRTAILNEGNVIGRVETRYTAALPGQQQKNAATAAGGGLQAGSSDYHFDDLRGLNSAY